MNRKRNRELAFFLSFSEACADFDPVFYCQQERPDFISKVGGKLVGIEITELLVSGEIKAREELEDQVLQVAKYFYNDASGPAVWVSVLFDFRPRISKIQIDHVGERLARKVLQCAQEQGRATVKLNRLPGIRSISVSQLGSTDRSYWGATRSGAIPTVSPVEIQYAIDQKESRIGDYRQECDDVWLLVVCEGYMPSTWYEVSESVVRAGYDTSFDRVYLYDFQNRREHQLANTKCV